MEKHEMEQNEIEIDLQELFLTVLHHWVRIVIAAALLAVVALVYSRLFITPMYTSTSQLYLISGNVTSLSDLQIGSYLTNDYIQVVAGRPVLDQVADNLNMDISYGQFSSKVSVSNPSDSRILNITVTDADPQNAKVIADEIAMVASDYISQKMAQDPPEILQYGYVSESPSTPNVLRNTLLGGLIGLLLALALEVVAYLLNDTIMTPEDMEKKVGLEVLGSIPLNEEECNGITSKKRKKPAGKSTAERSGTKKAPMGSVSKSAGDSARRHLQQ